MINKIKLLIRIVLLFLFFIFYGLITWLIVSDFEVFNRFYAFLFCLIINYLTSIAISFYILSSKRHESFKSVWIFIFLFIPALGILAFFMFGISGMKKFSLLKYKKTLKYYHNFENYEFTKKFLNNNNDYLKTNFNYVYNCSHYPVYENNKIEIFKNSNEHLKAIIDLIDKAEDFIHIHYFSFNKGWVVDYILKKLINKANQGVKIKILVDDYGTKKIFKNKKNLLNLKNAGIEIRWFNPLKKNILSLWNYRSHKKMFLVDNKYVITGSANLGDEYFNLSKKAILTQDICYLFEGEIVNSFNISFWFDWNNFTDNLSKNNLKWKKTKVVSNFPVFKIYKPEDLTTKIPVQVIESGPTINEQFIKDNLIRLLLIAKKEIFIVTPYFFPSNELLNAIKIASQSGVKIKIMFSILTDYKKLILIFNRNFYKELLQLNVEIYEYVGFNHSKIMIVDNELVYCGTYNWDFRSLFSNFEIATQIYSKDVANKFMEIINWQVQNSIKIDLGKLKKMTNKKDKLIMMLVNIVHPLL